MTLELQDELEEYLTELSGDTAAYMRPNFFVNTPDILHEYLQHGGRPAFEIRAVLASMLSPSQGTPGVTTRTSSRVISFGFSGLTRCSAMATFRPESTSPFMYV